MTSVINSARQSTASAFDFIGTTAKAANQLVLTATRGIDALDKKAEVMHRSITADCAIELQLIDETALYRGAERYTDLMEDISKRNYPSKVFNREDFFATAVAKLSTQP